MGRMALCSADRRTNGLLSVELAGRKVVLHFEQYEHVMRPRLNERSPLCACKVFLVWQTDR